MSLICVTFVSWVLLTTPFIPHDHRMHNLYVRDCCGIPYGQHHVGCMLLENIQERVQSICHGFHLQHFLSLLSCETWRENESMIASPHPPTYPHYPTQWHPQSWCTVHGPYIFHTGLVDSLNDTHSPQMATEHIVCMQGGSVKSIMGNTMLVACCWKTFGDMTKVPKFPFGTSVLFRYETKEEGP